MAHCPIDRPRLVVSADGSLAAVCETPPGGPGRVVVVDLPSLDAIAEVSIDPGAEGFDVAMLGTPPRMLVLARHADHTTVHWLEPHGPESLAEIRLASPVWLCGSVGVHALVIGGQGAAILTTTDTHVTPYQFPVRVKPTVAGAAANQFVVALPGVIEEWDPQARVPKRRLRLPRPAAISAVGGSERVVWMLTQQEPSRIDVLPLINRGQPKVHELPEPIAMVSGHPRSDLLACLGNDSLRVYALDLDGRTRLRSLAFPGLDAVDAVALVVGKISGVLAAQRARPLAFAVLEREVLASAASIVPTATTKHADVTSIDQAMSSLGDDTPTSVPPPSVAMPTAVAIASPPPLPPMPLRLDDVVTAPVIDEPTNPRGAPVTKNLAARFAAVRERRQVLRADGGPLMVPGTNGGSAPHSAPLDFRTMHSWREDCFTWARDVIGHPELDPPRPPDVLPIAALARRHTLPTELDAAIVLVYGAHLAGHDGVAPIDIARVLDRRWAEALGRGALARAKVVTFERSRIRLSESIERELDELP